ncbi:MAG TPA: MurR/RpiR family transcriptional regulator, partial [bacterium]|nr:MurR/RpiR family transcriptional regulator [bacterium]
MKASTGALKKIQVLMGSLSDSEKKLAEYLRLEREKIPFLSIYDVAKNAGVSTATVSRFVRKVGYKNFTELKIGIARDTDDSLQEIFSAINPDDSDEKIIQKVFHGNIKSIEDTYNIISIENLIKFAKAIAHSKRVLCIGIGGSGNVARDAALRLSHLNIQAEAYTDYYQILVQSLRTDKDTVVLGISHSGRSSITVEGLKLAKSKNA